MSEEEYKHDNRYQAIATYKGTRSDHGIESKSREWCGWMSVNDGRQQISRRYIQLIITKLIEKGCRISWGS